MISKIEVKRRLSTMDETGWAMVGMDGDGPGWVDFMWDDEHPKFMREYERMRDLLHEEEEPNQWLH